MELEIAPLDYLLSAFLGLLVVFPLIAFGGLRR